jgi:hypothetical protein
VSLHETSIITVGDSGYIAQCTCLARFRVRVREDQAEDDATQHSWTPPLAKKRTTLKDQRKFFQEQIDHPGTSDKDRELWTLLRDELDKRLGTDEEQEGLF